MAVREGKGVWVEVWEEEGEEVTETEEERVELREPVDKKNSGVTVAGEGEGREEREGSDVAEGEGELEMEVEEEPSPPPYSSHPPYPGVSEAQADSTPDREGEAVLSEVERGEGEENGSSEGEYSGV